MQERNIEKDGKFTLTYEYGGSVISQNTVPSFGSTSKLDLLITSNGPLVKPLTPHRHRYRIQERTALHGHRVNTKPNSERYSFVGDLYAPVVEVPGLPEISLLENEALDRLNDKVRGSLDLSVSGFEWHQTAQMLKLLTPKGMTNFAHEIYYKLSKRPNKGFKDWLYDSSGIASDLWLQYQYGWRPLMLDIYGAVDESLRVAQNGLQAFSASSMRTLVGDYPYEMGLGASGFQGSVGLKGKMACKYGLVLDANLLDSNRAQRWTSLNPISIAWELIPYSFVVDWFYDVGGFCRATETKLINDVSFVSGYKSIITAYDHIPTVSWVNDNIAGYTVNGHAQGSAKYTFFEREVLGGYPLPNLPRFKSNLGSSQLLSAAALLQQFLPKVPPSSRVRIRQTNMNLT